MGAVEDTRKIVQDFLAPELRTVSTRIEALQEEQVRIRAEIAATEKRLSAAIEQTHAEIVSSEARLHGEIVAIEARLRGDLIASETRVTAAIDRLRADLPLVVRNAVLEQLLAEKQRVIEDLQRSAH